MLLYALSVFLCYGIGATNAVEPLNEFDFTPFVDSGGGDIGKLSGSVDNFKKVCSTNPECLGFNSNGWYKKVLKPKDQWSKWTSNPTLGFYKKKKEALTVNPTKSLTVSPTKTLTVSPTKTLTVSPTKSPPVKKYHGTYYIKSTHDTYIQIVPTSSSPHTVMMSSYKTFWTQTIIVPVGNGHYALKSYYKNRFIQIRAGGTHQTMYTYVYVGSSEKFTITPVEDGKVVFKSAKWGNYLRAAPNYTRLTTNTETTSWEKFTLIPVEKPKYEGRFQIKSTHGTYLWIDPNSSTRYNNRVFLHPDPNPMRTDIIPVCVDGHYQYALRRSYRTPIRYLSVPDGGSHKTINTQSSISSSLERFTITPVEDGKVMFKSVKWGNYLSGGAGLTRLNTNTETTSSEKFTLIPIYEGTFRIKSTHGTYIWIDGRSGTRNDHRVFLHPNPSDANYLKIDIILLSDGHYALRGYKNRSKNRFIQIRAGGPHQSMYTSNYADKFAITPVEDGKVVFKSAKWGNYLSGEAGITRLITNTSITSSEKFTLIPV